jgi:hypothetical protein
VTGNIVELCAGREGDDVYVSFEAGCAVTAADVDHAKDIIAYFHWAQELAEDNKRYSEGIRPRPRI